MKRGIAAALVVLSMSSCSDNREEIPNGTATDRSTSTTASASPPGGGDSDRAAATDDAVVASYQRYWQIRQQVNDPPAPSSPLLETVATGVQLEQLRAETSKNAAEGVSLRPASAVVRSKVDVTERRDDEATIQECVIDDLTVVRTDSGEVLNADVATHSVQATLQLVGDQWKVASVRLLQRWEGVAGCAISTGI